MKERQETNLITTWLACELQMEPFRTLTDVVDVLNLALKRNYRLSRIREWERGQRTPDPIAHNYILSRTLPYAVAGAAGSGRSLSKAAIERLLEKISLPIEATGA